MARVRAEESARADRLFDDPYAQAFVANSAGVLPEGRPAGGRDLMAGVLHGAVIRTRCYDDFRGAHRGRLPGGGTHGG